MKKPLMLVLALLIIFVSVCFSENDTDAYKTSFFVDEVQGIFDFLDSNYDSIIEPIFEWAALFGGDGLSEVSIQVPDEPNSQLWRYIIADGTFLFEPQLINNVPSFNEDSIAVISIDGLYAYIRSDGTFLFDSKFEEADPFSNGIARVKKDGLYGYITSSGTYLFEPQFEKAEQFFKEITVVSLKGEFGLVNRAGEYVLSPSLQYIYGFDSYDTITRAKYNELWGFINREGDFIIKPVFSEISYSMYGCYIVKGRDFLRPESNEMYGLVDWEGNLLLNPVFEEITIDTCDGIVHAVHPSGEKLILVLDEQYWLRFFEEKEEDDGFDWESLDWDSYEYDEDA